jgi:hypothetical protein
MRTLKERFEAKFVKGDGCWEWTACKDRGGYGQFGFAGRQEGAHRVSYQMYVGELPDGLCVLHHCDNPSCVNPAHLFLGTNADNTRDCLSKGRVVSSFGENNGKSKLTTTQISEIRKMYAAGTIQRVIAKEFGVTRACICHIVLYKRWAKI